MESFQPFDALLFFRELNKAGIKYLLIGRRALVFHGASVQTQDYDFCVSHEKASMDDFLSLCDQHGWEVVPFGTDDPVKSYKLSVHAGAEKIDVFRAKAYSMKTGGSVTFDEMWASHKVIRLDDGTQVNVPSLECLEKTKRIRMSPKDVEDIKFIRELIMRRNHEGKPREQ